MNPKASFGNRFRSKLRGIKPSVCGIVQLTNSAALRFRNWSFTIKKGNAKSRNPLMFMVGGAGIEPATSTV